MVHHWKLPWIQQLWPVQVVIKEEINMRVTRQEAGMCRKWHVTRSPVDIRTNSWYRKPRNGWYLFSDSTNLKISQSMVSPSTHLELPNKAKGMRHVLLERGFDLRRKRKTSTPNSDDCCYKHILGKQLYFMEQKSLVQEAIKAAGHLCVFLAEISLRA